MEEEGYAYDSSNGVLYGVAVVVILLLSICIFRNAHYVIERAMYRYPPGPIGIPIFGNLLSAINLPKYGDYLYEEYGNVTMICFGSKRWVYLHTIDVINDVLNKQKVINRSIGRGLHLRHIKPEEMSIAAADTKYWWPKRRRFQCVVGSILNSSFINNVHNYSLQTHVIKSINDCIENNKSWYPQKDIEYLQFNSFWNACYGTYLLFDSNERHLMMKIMRESLVQISTEMFIRSIILFQYIIPKFIMNKILNSFRKLDDLLEASIYKHCTDEYGNKYDENIFNMNDTKWTNHFNKMLKDDDANLISKLIAMHRANPVADSTKRGITGDLGTMFVAGVDSTARANEYGITLLAKNPQIQEEIYNQVFEIFGTDWKMENISFKSVSHRLHLLRAFIYETLRISSIVAIGVPRIDFERDIWIKNARDKNGNLYTCCIPKGAEIIMNVANAHRNDKYWRDKTNDKPMNVNLDLWLDDKKKFKSNLNKDKMVAFGVGKRNCAGSALAVRSLLLIFAKWILLYKFSVHDSNIQIKQKFAFGFAIDPEIPVCVEKR